MRGIGRVSTAAGGGIAAPSCWNAYLAHRPRLIHTRAAPPGLTHFGFANDFDELYEVTEYLGSGSFGSVHVCVERATGNSFAVKTVGKKKLGSYLEPHFMRRVQHEVDMFNHMGRSLNVVHLRGVYENDKCVDLVMQLCTGGELWKRIKLGAYGEVQAARLIREVLRAIAQPENFLFLDDSDDSPLKMIDFGIAEYCTEGQELEDRAGTPIYCAPEVLRKRYGLKADVWSAGIIAYQLLTARLPFESDNGGLLAANLNLSHAQLTNREIFSAILYAPLDYTSPPWDTISPGAKEFVQHLLQRDPALRPSAAEALEHPWLKAATSAATIHTGSFASVGSMDVGGGDRGVANSVHPASPTSSPTLDDSLVQRLQRYGTYAKLKRLCLSKVASFMTDYDSKALSQLRVALGNVAVDRSGNNNSYKIPYQKMVEVLKSGQWQLSEVEVRQLLSSFTIDADGCMDASEWLAALTEWKEVQQTSNWEDLVNQAFSAIDQDGSGQLSTAELESLLCGDEACVIEDTVPAALREAQADVDVACATDWEGVGGRDAAAGCSTMGGPKGRKLGVSLVLDRPAFARLLQMAKQDRLDLFEGRWARRRRSASMGPAGAEEEEEGREERPAGDLVAH